MRILMVIAVSIPLGACQTVEQRMATDNIICQSYGVAPGTQGYIQCRMNLDNNRANVNASERFGQGEGLISRIGRATEK
jgi:hypothetical protein